MKEAISRYSNLKLILDNQEWNNNWVEVNTLNVDCSKSNLTFVDLFSGAGGMSVGATMAGLVKLGGVEIDKDAHSTISTNFKDVLNYNKPIQELTVSDILKWGKVDIVFGGPPCQGFSVAGKRNPNDPRNVLFKEYFRVVEVLKPKYIVMENVPGMITMSNGKVLQEIIETLSSLGYVASVRILESAQFEVPQLRTRVIIVANNIGYPNPYPSQILNKSNYLTINDAIDDLKFLDRDAKINHEWTRHSSEFTDRINKIKAGDSLYKTFRDAYKRQYSGLPSMTVKENHGGTHIHYELDRVISVREMARLQTFPDDFIFKGTFKRAYWQVGNAVPCKLAKHIALSIKSILEV